MTRRDSRAADIEATSAVGKRIENQGLSRPAVGDGAQALARLKTAGSSTAPRIGIWLRGQKIYDIFTFLALGSLDSKM